MGLSPTFRNHTPPVAGLQTRKAKLGRRCDQVIADAPLVLQEFCGNHCAYQVDGLIGPGAAAAIAIEARDRVCTAGLQFGTKDIGLSLHTPSVAGPWTLRGSVRHMALRAALHSQLCSRVGHGCNDRDKGRP